MVSILYMLKIINWPKAVYLNYLAYTTIVLASALIIQFVADGIAELEWLHCMKTMQIQFP